MGLLSDEAALVVVAELVEDVEVVTGSAGGGAWGTTAGSSDTADVVVGALLTASR